MISQIWYQKQQAMKPNIYPGLFNIISREKIQNNDNEHLLCAKVYSAHAWSSVTSVMSDSLWPHGLQHSQASLSITNYQSLLKLISIELVMPSNHLILCRPLLLLPSIFSHHQSLFHWVSSSHQVAKVFPVSALASFLPVNIQDWFPLGLTGWISLQSKGLSRVSNTTVQNHQFFGNQLPL